MPAVRSEEESVRRELEEVLKSPGFARNERLSQFLRFVVEKHLEGRDHELKESVIGTEVFGRKPDYSPKADPIVRTEARRLRDRLTQYYERVEESHGVRIELPKGGYVPVVRCAAGEARTSALAPQGITGHFTKWRLILVCSFTILLAVFGFDRLRSAGQMLPYTRSPAYDLYVSGRDFLKRPALRGVEDSIDLFTRAIAKDPSFAPGYAGIAAGLAARSGFDQFNDADRAQMLATGWSDAATAIRLDRQSAHAQDALGMMQARSAQWPQAESSFQRAIKLAPQDPLWREHLAVFLLLPLGRIEEAIAQLGMAEELDPNDRATHFALVDPLRKVGRFDEADSHCLRAAENDRQASSCWSAALRRQGKADQAIETLEASLSGHLLEPGAAQSLGVAYARAGRRDDAERMAALAPRLASKAQIYAALGDKDRTFATLDQMAPLGPTRLGRDFLNSSNFSFLRGDPRLKELRKKIGLPE
jgi:tetratricopeptide (TPR) repeat protein